MRTYKSYLFIQMVVLLCILAIACNENVKLMNNNPTEDDVYNTGVDTGVFFKAVRNGDLITVKNQLINNRLVNSKDANNETAIIMATDRKDIPMVQLLLEHGADVNISSDKIDNTPIMIASVKGYTDLVQLLVERSNPDMTILNGYGGTALIPACERGHVDVVRLLLEKTKVKVNHVNRLGWTAMLEAIVLSNGGKSQQEIVKLLLAHGADKNIADKNGITPLQHAQKKGFKALAEILAD
jgi:uncharacterized protein